MGTYSQGHICQCLTRLSSLRSNSLVTISGHRQKSGRKFVQDVLRLAGGLLQLGLRIGDIVAISAYNSDLYLEWILAVAFVGGIVAPLNYRWSFEEARAAMLAVRPVMLVTDESCSNWYSELQDALIPSLTWHVSLTSSLKYPSSLNVLTTETLKMNSARSLSMNYMYAADGAVIICFTSGTTGRPKGVTISHSALIIQSLAKIAIVGYSENDVYLHTAPICHIGGLSSAIAMLMVGACHVLIPKFEAKAVIEAIEQHQVTSLITVPAMMADLVLVISCQETWKGRDSVRRILNGGGGLPVELIKDAKSFFPKAKILSAYGMTETCSSLTFMTLSDPTFEISSQIVRSFSKSRFNSVQQPQGVCIGKPAPHVELIIDVDSSPHVGRILTRGPHVMLRYWGHVPVKAQDSGNDAWLDTGDVGSIDEFGNIWLIGRRNGRIKTGGENVYPEEVEAILSQHHGVKGVVVAGIPDARLIEMVVACIRLREGWQWSDTTSEYKAKSTELILSTEILRHYCKLKNLTGFKIPKVFMPWKKPFPLTTTGKIRRDQVGREAASQFQTFRCNL